MYCLATLFFDGSDFHNQYVYTVTKNTAEKIGEKSFVVQFVLRFFIVFPLKTTFLSCLWVFWERPIPEKISLVNNGVGT